MPVADLSMAASFTERHSEELTAAATLIASLVLAKLTDRSLLLRGRKLGEVVSGGTLSPVADTRLRLVRRLVFATIIVIGIALALSQFPSVKRVATGVLASSAVLGLVVGFAARQTLANAIAGILLAITQPIRIGDLVTFEEQTGEVEEVRLTYTYIRCDDGRRLIVPNERLAQSTIQNHTIVDPHLQVEVSVWLEPGSDVSRGLELLSRAEGVEARIADVEREGIRVAVSTTTDFPGERGQVAARLREESLRRLRGESLS